MVRSEVVLVGADAGSGEATAGDGGSQPGAGGGLGKHLVFVNGRIVCRLRRVLRCMECSRSLGCGAVVKL